MLTEQHSCFPDRIYVPGWFQIDFETIEQEDTTVTLRKIFKLIKALKDLSLITKWFFLHENKTIRVRFKTKKNKILKNLIDKLCEKKAIKIDKIKNFEKYWEANWAFENLDCILVFADIMFQISELVIKKEEGEIKFENYRLVERISHCIHNIIYGTMTEEAFLIRRLNERYKFENTNDSLLELERKNRNLII